MTTSPIRHLAHLTWTDIKALDKREGVVILPVGAIEQHGPHLPTLTDTLLVTHMLAAALPLLPDHVRAWALPPLNYGKSNEHTNFPGTMSLSAQTLTAVLHDIAASVHRADFRRLSLYEWTRRQRGRAGSRRPRHPPGHRLDVLLHAGRSLHGSAVRNDRRRKKARFSRW
ncbi:MAG: creatininase family protein [Caldilineaceae bacterium]